MAAQPMNSARYALAIDLGGTQVRAAVVDRLGKVLSRAAETTRADEGTDVVISQIVSLARKVQAQAGTSELAGAGISSPGPLDTQEGIALGIPTLKGFSDFPLRARLAEALDLPIMLENDGIAAAVGEWRYGVGRGLNHLVYVTVSTGIGGGVVAGGRVLRGRRGMACHLGHMSFVAGGEVCFCGNRGCFEAYASGTAFTKRAIAAARVDASTSLGRDGSAITAPAVFEAAAVGDALARTLVDEEARLLGVGFASLAHIFNPDLIVMGGGLSQQFDMLKEAMLRSLKACAMPAFRDTPVVKAALGVDSGLLGAASLVFEAH